MSSILLGFFIRPGQGLEGDGRGQTIKQKYELLTRPPTRQRAEIHRKYIQQVPIFGLYRSIQLVNIYVSREPKKNIFSEVLRRDDFSSIYNT